MSFTLKKGVEITHDEFTVWSAVFAQWYFYRLKNGIDVEGAASGAADYADEALTAFRAVIKKRDDA